MKINKKTKDEIFILAKRKRLQYLLDEFTGLVTESALCHKRKEIRGFPNTNNQFPF